MVSLANDKQFPKGVVLIYNPISSVSFCLSPSSFSLGMSIFYMLAILMGMLQVY